jgi:hypothetical protein
LNASGSQEIAKSPNITQQYASPGIFFPYSQPALAVSTPSPYSFYVMNTSYMSSLYDALGIKTALTSASYVCSQIQSAVPKSSLTTLEEDLWTAWSAASRPLNSDNLPSSRKLLDVGSVSAKPAISSCQMSQGSAMCQLTVPGPGTFNLVIESPGFLTSYAELTISSAALSTDVVVPIPPSIPASQTLFLISWTSGERLNVQISTPFGCILNSESLQSFCSCGSTTVSMTMLAPGRYQVLIQSPVAPDASSLLPFTYALLVTPPTISSFGDNIPLNAPIALATTFATNGLSQKILELYANTLRINCSSSIGFQYSAFTIEVMTSAGTFLAGTSAPTSDHTPAQAPFQISVAGETLGQVTLNTSSPAQVDIVCVSPPCPSAFFLSFGTDAIVPTLVNCQCSNCQGQSQLQLVPLSFSLIKGAQSFSSFMISGGSIFPASMNTNFSCLFTTGTKQKGHTSMSINKRTFVPLRVDLRQVLFVADQQQLVPAKLQPSYGFATFTIVVNTQSILTPSLTFSDIAWSSLSSQVTSIGIYSLTADLSGLGPLFYGVCGSSAGLACSNGTSAFFPGFQLPVAQSKTLYNSMLTGSPVYYLSIRTDNNLLGEIGSVLRANNFDSVMSENSLFPPILNPNDAFVGLKAIFSADTSSYNGPLYGENPIVFSQILAPSAAVNVSIDLLTNPSVPFSSFSSCQMSNAALRFPQNSFLLSAPGPLASFNQTLSDSNTISINLNAPMSPGPVNIVLPANFFKLKNVVAALSVASSGKCSPSSSSPLPSSFCIPLS